MRRWIAAPDPSDTKTAAELCERFRNVPRISEAWLVGSHMTPDDGSPSRESTDIALVLDPPLPDDSHDAKQAIVSFLGELDEQVPWSKPGRGWLLVSASLIREYQQQAVQIHSRTK